MKRKIYLKLLGGLGNQLFQYSCAKNLSIELKGELIIDDKLGFFFDKNFNRVKSLPPNLKYSLINYKDLFLFHVLILIKKIFFKNDIFFSFGKHIIIDETVTKSYINNFLDMVKKYEKIFLVGFFQSEKYFIKNKDTIISKILANKIKNSYSKKIKNKITNNSICIGVRMFEEAPVNIKHKFGGIENFSFYNNSINYFKKKTRKPNFFLYSTLRDKNKIKKNINTQLTIINNKKITKNSDFEFLLLISSYSKFIISNSSYYWWGAYLSEHQRKIKIIVSKKYVNISTLPKRWLKLKNKNF